MTPQYEQADPIPLGQTLARLKEWKNTKNKEGDPLLLLVFADEHGNEHKCWISPNVVEKGIHFWLYFEKMGMDEETSKTPSEAWDSFLNTHKRQKIWHIVEIYENKGYRNLKVIKADEASAQLANTWQRKNYDQEEGDWE